MGFKDWLVDSEKEIKNALDTPTKVSEIIDTNRGHNLLLPYYIQYRLWKENKSLVWATWFLAIATIILSVLTLYIK